MIYAILHILAAFLPPVALAILAGKISARVQRQQRTQPHPIIRDLPIRNRELYDQTNL